MKDEYDVLHPQLKETKNAAENIDSDRYVNAPSFSPTAQLKPVEEEEEEIQMKKASFQMKKEEEEEEEIQMKEGPFQGKDENAESSDKTSMPEEVQSKMEGSFGADFSDVNIHSNSTQAENMGAQAFAQGNDVHFAPGKFEPGSKQGQQLLGHELTHVVQQRQGRVNPTKQLKGNNVNDNESLEQEADQMGNKAAEGQSVGIGKSDTKSTSETIQNKGGDEEEKAIRRSNHAVTLHEAMDGWGTDEDAIFEVLAPLSRADVKSVKSIYERFYGVSLFSELRSELNDTHFTRALRLMFYWPYASGALGSFQVEQAREKILEMPGWEVDMFSDMLDLQPTSTHRSYIFKALAAGNSIVDIITFAYRIKNQDVAWLNENLRLTGSATTRTNTHGAGEQIPAGLQQQWNDSCTPTSALTIRGELDPIYALSVHDANPNLYGAAPTSGTDVNPGAAGEQRTLMQGRGGVATPRGTSGTGNRITDIDEDWTGDMGLDYDYSHIPTDLTMDQAITQINSTLASGVPVPMRIAGAGTGGHATSIISRSGSNYQVHDPWAGGLVTVSEAAIRNSTFNIAGWNQMTHIGIPD